MPSCLRFEMHADASFSLLATIAAYALISICRLVFTPDSFRHTKFGLGKLAKPFYLIAFVWNCVVFAVRVARMRLGLSRLMWSVNRLTSRRSRILRPPLPSTMARTSLRTLCLTTVLMIGHLLQCHLCGGDAPWHLFLLLHQPGDLACEQDQCTFVEAWLIQATSTPEEGLGREHATGSRQRLHLICFVRFLRFNSARLGHLAWPCDYTFIYLTLLPVLSTCDINVSFSSAKVGRRRRGCLFL